MLGITVIDFHVAETCHTLEISVWIHERNLIYFIDEQDLSITAAEPHEFLFSTEGPEAEIKLADSQAALPNDDFPLC